MKKGQKTTIATAEDTTRPWVHIDVTDCIVGRAASKIADILRGKDKPTYTPHTDAGSFVIITNAEKIRFTGAKLAKKVYYHHTGFMGGMKSITAEKQLEKRPENIMWDAVWGMMPKTSLSKLMMRKLKIFAGSEHPHAAQQPTQIKI